VLKLRKLLEKYCDRSYSGALDEVALVLRIDGSVQAWGQSGVSNTSISKKKRYVTADIFMTEATWQSGGKEVRAFLASHLREAIELMAEVVQKAKLDFSSDALLADIDAAVVAYLSD